MKTNCYESSKTAVTLIEYQNDLTLPGGSLQDAVEGVMESSNRLDNTFGLVVSAAFFIFRPD